MDTSVLMESDTLRRLLLAADVRLLQPVWSAQVAGELARAGLWRLVERRPDHRTIGIRQHEVYRAQLYRRIDEIDLRFEIVRLAPVAPVHEEAAWAAATDGDHLHVQLLARTALADCVVSWNHRDFPHRQVVGGRPCGELCGVLWLTPDQLPALRLPAPEVAP